MNMKKFLMGMLLIVVTQTINAENAPYSNNQETDSSVNTKETGAEYAYIYNYKAKKVDQGAAVKFDFNGQISSGIAHKDGDAEITLKNEGVYLVTFRVMTGSRNSFGLFLSDTPIEGGTFDGYAQQYNTNTVGQVIIKAKAGSVITLRHYYPDLSHFSDQLSKSVSLYGGTFQTFKDNKQIDLILPIVNASIVILKIA